MKKFNILPYLFVFLVTFMILQFFQGNRGDSVLDTGSVGLKTLKTEYTLGKDIRVVVQNNETEPIDLVWTCIATDGGMFLTPPFRVEFYQNESFEAVSSTHLPECTENQTLTIQPGEKETVSLIQYSYSYFGGIGRYKLELELPEPSDTYPEMTGIYSTPEFQVQEPGVVTKLWRTFIYQPLLNALVAILIYLPGHPLVWAIVLLTLAIRTILLIPSQKSMKAQRRMQEIQPRLEELKKTYANDQARLAQETMILWKEAKVNPLSSCLPLLIQLPILIALYSVISGGLSPDRSVLIYPFLPAFSLHEINTYLFGFNLLDHSLVVLPLIVGGLQFTQMQLMMYKRNKKKGDSDEKKTPNEMEMANKMMKYIMPFMIAIFTAQLPAAVGLYWAVSTFYGIIQQLVVNKEGSKPLSPSDDVQIRVINRHNGKAN